MPEDEDYEDPELLAADARPSFWATVEWRLGLGLVVVVLAGIFAFFMSLFNARHPLDVPLITAGFPLGMAVLWVMARILWAWVEWPSRNWFARGLKAVIRYFAFDAAAERRDSRRPDPPEGHSQDSTSAP